MKDKKMGLSNYKAPRLKICCYGLISLLFFCLFFIREINAGACGNEKADDAYKEGMASFKEKMYNAARQSFEKAVRFDPNCVEARYQLGVTYTYLIPFQDLAIVEFKKIQELVPDTKSSAHVRAVFNEGLALLRMGAYEDAIIALKKAKDLDPTYKDLDKLHNYLGVAYCFLNNYEEAIREFKKAIQENATYREANYNLKSVNMRLLYFNVGVTYGFMGNYRQAIEQLNKAIEISTNFYNAHLEIARIYIREGMYGDAISELIRCERINPNHRNTRKVYMNLGIAYYNQGSPKIAVEYLRKALKLESDYEDAIKNLRSIFGGYDPLKDVKIDPLAEKEKYIQSRMEVARDYFMVGLFEKSVALCNEVLNIDFQNKEAADMVLSSYSFQADSYIAKKDYSNAIKALKALLKVTPDSLETWYKLGMSYYSMEGHYWYKEAEEAFRKSVSVEGARYYLAQIYYEQKKYDDARGEAELAIKNNPDNPEYHLLLAKIYKALNLLDDAEGACKQCIELDSENEECQKLLRDVIKARLRPNEPKGDGEDAPAEELEVDYKTMIKRGLSYAKREDYDKAIQVFRDALEKEPEGVEARNNIGSCILFKKKYNESLIEFMIVSTMNPKDADLHINMAINYYCIKDYKNAKDEYLKAVTINGELAKDAIYQKLVENGSVPLEVFLPKVIWKNIK